MRGPRKRYNRFIKTRWKYDLHRNERTIICDNNFRHASQPTPFNIYKHIHNDENKVPAIFASVNELTENLWNVCSNNSRSCIATTVSKEYYYLQLKWRHAWLNPTLSLNLRGKTFDDIFLRFHFGFPTPFYEIR